MNYENNRQNSKQHERYTCTNHLYTCINQICNKNVFILAVSAVYVSPTVSVDGSYTFTTSFATDGTWIIGIADGISTNYSVLNQYRLSIIGSDTTYDGTLTFP